MRHQHCSICLGTWTNMSPSKSRPLKRSFSPRIRMLFLQGCLGNERIALDIYNFTCSWLLWHCFIYITWFLHEYELLEARDLDRDIQNHVPEHMLQCWCIITKKYHHEDKWFIHAGISAVVPAGCMNIDLHNSSFQLLRFTSTPRMPNISTGWYT